MKRVGARKSKQPYVYRAVYPQDGVDGYLAKVIRHTGKLQKVFQLSAFGGRHGRAMRAAAAAVKAFTKKHPKLSRRQLAVIHRTKKDSDLPVGVRRVRNKVKGKFYDYFEAAWSPKPNQPKKKRFSVNLFGEDEACEMAIKARQRGLKDMED
jgi:hypothetical protein